MFTEAVKILLEEKGEEKQRPQATIAIEWKAGPGRWSEAIGGLKKDADLPYDEAVLKSSASGAKSVTLMARLGITKKSTKSDTLESAFEILSQAVNSPVMSQLYGKPVLDKNSITVPVKLSMEKEDIDVGEGVSGRNATVFIHLSLIGAYNAKMFLPTEKLKVTTASPTTKAVIIKKA